MTMRARRMEESSGPLHYPLGTCRRRCATKQPWLVCPSHKGGTKTRPRKPHLQLHKFPTRKDDLHVAQCNTIEKATFEAMLAASGSAEPPSCPQFSCVPRSFADQFCIGHYNYWRSEDVTYDTSQVGPAILERISQLYRWRKGNWPQSSTPKPNGARIAPALSEVH